MKERTPKHDKGDRGKDNNSIPRQDKSSPTIPQRMSQTSGIKKPPRHRRLLSRRPNAKPPTPLSIRNPPLAQKLSDMLLPIAPILHATTGLPAPAFPSTLLSLFLLTESQLDSLATFYSQSHTPTHLTHAYPLTMDWSHPFLDSRDELPEDCKLDCLERLKVKMRMFARFIGMRGAETPLWEYERQVEILRAKIRWGLQREEEESGRGEKGWEGLGRRVL